MSNLSASGTATASAAVPDTLLDAIEILVGGRNLDAQTAQSLGLVDEIALDAHSAVEVAAQLAREYILTGAGRLADAFARRQAATRQWTMPQTSLSRAEVEAHPRVARLLAQARAVGREKTVQRILDCLFFGLEQGYLAGLKHEAQVFAEAVADPEGGQAGIQAFLDKKSAPLPPRPLILVGSPAERTLLERGELLPLGTPFYPGLTPLPKYQYAQGIIKDPLTGAALHGDPKDVEQHVIVPVLEPRPTEALVYVLASEVNFNDIWALTGIPISVMDDHDQDVHITGSGGVGLIVALGSEVKREGRLQVGDLVSIYSGQNDLLSPMVGLDPMFADFSIQGYQGPNGSHGQFLLVQAPQLHHKLEDLTIEAAGSYMLNLGTIYRALFTTLKVEPGKRLFVEGAATGTGFEALKVGVRNNVKVTGLVSSAERAAFVKQHGATGVINRRAPELADCFTKVPADPAQWAAWEAAGLPLLEAFRSQNDGQLADYVISHAGERAFPRSFQLLGPGGTLTFYGASSGYHFTFMGKPGAAAPAEMLQRVGLRAGQAALVYYGIGDDLVDETGIEIIEAVREAHARVVVATRTDGQKEFVASLGFGDAVRGIVSLEDIRRRYGADFVWPTTMPALPDPKTDTAAFREAVRLFTELTFKPFAAAIGRLLAAPDNPRGYPDVIVERAGQDTLGVSTMLVKPYTGRVVYTEEMSGRRYSFYAPQVWMRQRRIDMPTANIWGTHLNNAYEVLAMNDAVAAGLLEVTPPVVVAWQELSAAHQAMWDNRHAGATYVVNHALPRLGLKTKEELFEAWAAQASGTTGANGASDASVIFR